jgi:hypothetical protein
MRLMSFKPLKADWPIELKAEAVNQGVSSRDGDMLQLKADFLLIKADSFDRGCPEASIDSVPHHSGF